MQIQKTTWLAGRSIRQAWLILLATLAGISCCLLASFRQEVAVPPSGQGGSDLRLYGRVVARVHAGESYYDAAGAELREGGYR
jgi:hypothetical protein